MPKQKSWLEIELAEKRELLEAFYNERILKLNQRSIDGFKEFLIHTHFPKDPTWQEKIDNLFSDAISKKINFEQFFDALKYLPFMLIRGMGNHEQFTKSKVKEPTVAQAEIDPTDLIKIQENIKQYIADKNITASVSFGSAEGTILTNLQDNKSYSYAIHSVGKVFTGILVMLMMIKGMISNIDLKEPIKLNDSVKKDLPEAVRKQLEKVSLHQVMTHKAALSDYLGNYCAAISEGKIPVMKNVEDFLQFAEDNFYLTATETIPDDSQLRPFGYFLVKKIDGWNLTYISMGETGVEKQEIKVSDVEGLNDALKKLPNKPSTELSKVDLSVIYGLLNKHYCDTQVGKERYSNLGILLVGLALKQAYVTKKGIKYDSCDYNDILKEFIINQVGMPSFTSWKPENAKFNPADPEAAHSAGSPAGGYWVSAEDLAKFAQWIYKQCKADPKLELLMKEYGQEFYNEDRLVAHGGAIPSSSAFFSVSLKTSALFVALSDQPLMAIELNSMIQENVFSKWPEVSVKKTNEQETQEKSNDNSKRAATPENVALEKMTQIMTSGKLDAEPLFSQTQNKQGAPTNSEENDNDDNSTNSYVGSLD